MSRLALLLVLMLVSFPGAAGAQESLALSSGSRVRVWTSSAAGPVTGKVLRVDASAMMLAVDGSEPPIVVPRDAITRLDVSRGRRSRGKNALIGALVGLAAAGIVLAGDTSGPNGGPGIGSGVALLFLPPTGTLVGAMFPPGHERWRPAKLAASTGPAPSVRFGFRF